MRAKATQEMMGIREPKPMFFIKQKPPPPFFTPSSCVQPRLKEQAGTRTTDETSVPTRSSVPTGSSVPTRSLAGGSGCDSRRLIGVLIPAFRVVRAACAAEEVDFFLLALLGGLDTAGRFEAVMVVGRVCFAVDLDGALTGVAVLADRFTLEVTLTVWCVCGACVVRV
jgi:hypothetical protein